MYSGDKIFKDTCWKYEKGEFFFIICGGHFLKPEKKNLAINKCISTVDFKNKWTIDT